MAQYYAEAQGGRGATHRLGHKTTGAYVRLGAQSGGISARTWWDASLQTDMCEVSLIPWQGAGTARILYQGPISGLPQAQGVNDGLY